MRDALAQGRATALTYTGSREQNGPHMAIGKHSFIAHYPAMGLPASAEEDRSRTR